ncbi:MAG TPA: hypothetical protein DCQ14_03640 [Firmicutes bacterium]|nr:hypothetical protein [Bacillota bacterium]
MHEHVMTVKTKQRVEFCDITAQVNEFLQQERAGDGCLLLFVPHTTAAVTVNEGADPSVRSDLAAFLEKLVPRTGDYMHAEGNSDAHIKASLLGSSLYLPVKNGKLALGFWQAVFFVEFDGPRMRRLHLQFLS